jgi:Zn ribbon nucleic-acid-binding protein
VIVQGVICDKCGELATIKTHDSGYHISVYGCRCGHEMKRTPEKSVGHIAFYGDHEFLYAGGNNSVWRVPINNTMEKTPYGNVRTGCRFESTMKAWDHSPIYACILREAHMRQEENMSQSERSAINS